MANFPEYKHLVTALQNIQVDDGQASYQVTVKRHDRLLILSSLAEKFLESDDLKDQVRETIDAHNAQFNPDGDYWAEPEQARTTCTQKCLTQIYLFVTSPIAIAKTTAL